jgi:anti-sigma factor ChrR (cupin superfamily)
VTTPFDDQIEFDDPTLIAIAEALPAEQPGPAVKAQLLARAGVAPAPLVPSGFVLRLAGDDWFDHPLPGIRMKVLAVNPERTRATLLIDAVPGARFPPHHHNGDEECYVVSGDVHTLGRTLGPGDFLHADSGTDHGELFTVGGAVVLLVVHPEDYIPNFSAQP